MNHFSLEGEHVKIDYSNPALPPAARNFMPDVYRDGPEYFCVLGAGSDAVILGTGSTPDEAINAWEQAYHDKAGR
ncbi:hypothetical protein HGH92_02380 [Chitinophaga varians]|uniref:Uncharacterized protein n=1 Tax=Chitinophaga varians TaxID=2202339 RepID=A0A847RJ78_9BACT|nr:hypothetical protein [Chitinophaga varians]NLR63143.1 hypothetical protein [Chitinophaga varians]